MVPKKVDQNDALKVLEEHYKIAENLKNELWTIDVIKANCDDRHCEHAVECKIPMQNWINYFYFFF